MRMELITDYVKQELEQLHTVIKKYQNQTFQTFIFFDEITVLLNSVHGHKQEHTKYQIIKLFEKYGIHIIIDDHNVIEIVPNPTAQPAPQALNVMNINHDESQHRLYRKQQAANQIKLKSSSSSSTESTELKKPHGLRRGLKLLKQLLEETHVQYNDMIHNQSLNEMVKEHREKLLEAHPATEQMRAQSSKHATQKEQDPVVDRSKPDIKNPNTEPLLI